LLITRKRLVIVGERLLLASTATGANCYVSLLLCPGETAHSLTGDVPMDEPVLFHDQLLATKFFVPSSSHPLIARPQLTTLLNQGLRRKLTLIAAPVGFGKTTLLSTWVQSF
jgi:hypothetical protein